MVPAKFHNIRLLQTVLCNHLPHYHYFSVDFCDILLYYNDAAGKLFSGNIYFLRGTAMFTKKQLWALLIPLMVEQVLNSLMGTADTMMVSNVGSAAISAVSLVDSINTLILNIFFRVLGKYTKKFRLLSAQTQKPEPAGIFYSSTL